MRILHLCHVIQFFVGMEIENWLTPTKSKINLCALSLEAYPGVQRGYKLMRDVLLGRFGKDLRGKKTFGVACA
jgi:hypothetical protein